MAQKPQTETPVEASNKRAVAWARQMMARKCAEQKRMAEEFKTNYKLQEALAKLREENRKENGDAESLHVRLYKFLAVRDVLNI